MHELKDMERFVKTMYGILELFQQYVLCVLTLSLYYLTSLKLLGTLSLEPTPHP